MIFQKGKSIAVFSSDNTTLEAAKKDAAMRVGLYSTEWRDIGPAMELPD